MEVMEDMEDCPQDKTSMTSMISMAEFIYEAFVSRAAGEARRTLIRPCS